MSSSRSLSPSPSPSPSRPHRKFKSDAAADKALKQISTIEILEQINLFETVLQLYSIGALTRLENEKLQNNYNTELTRKSLLVTSIIPGKGCYKGMRYLRRALKKTGQCVLLDKLDKAYEDAVDVLIAENLHLIEMEDEDEDDDTTGRSTSLGAQARMATHLSVKRRSSSFDSPAPLKQQNGELNSQMSPSHSPDFLLYRDTLWRSRNGNGVVVTKKTSVGSVATDISTDDEVDGDGANVFVLDNAEHERSLEQSVGINIQFSLPSDYSGVSLPPIVVMTPDAAPSRPFSPFRERSAHISHRVNPRKKFSDPTVDTTFVKSQSEDYPSPVSPCFTKVRSISFESNQQHQTNGSLQDGLNNYIDKPKELKSRQSVDQIKSDCLILKIVIVGDSSTGKTSLLNQYIYDKFSIAYRPTIPLDFHSTELTCYDTKYKLHLWDTAGQERYKSITKAYYRDAVGALVVYDVTDKKSMEHCLQWKEEIDDTVYLTNGDPIPVVLIANKVDHGQLDGEQFSKDHGFIGYFETSAKTGKGIQEAIHFMVKKVHQLTRTHQEPVVQTLNRNRTSIKLRDTGHERSSKCC
ncbi:uncharacterized protein [Dysidea avara]|uniref:uncharacterized protein isoform X2 n=1 Tax=Dysidea avara TaxID=196820 RepID=UPI00332F12C8